MVEKSASTKSILNERQEDILNFRPPERIQKHVIEEGGCIQRIESSSSIQTNVDSYRLEISSMPNLPSVERTPEGLFEYIRTHLISVGGDSSLFGNQTAFKPYSPEDRRRWRGTSGTSDGAIMIFDSSPRALGIADLIGEASKLNPRFKHDIPFLNEIPHVQFDHLTKLAVVGIMHNDLSWTFSTIFTPRTQYHSVSGARRFSLISSSSNYTFVTEGVDRVSNKYLNSIHKVINWQNKNLSANIYPNMDEEEIASQITPNIYEAGEIIWKNLMINTRDRINKHGGEARIVAYESNRHPWSQIKDSWDPTGSWVSCDEPVEIEIPPAPIPRIDRSVVSVGEEVKLDGAHSIDIDGTIERYQWDVFKKSDITYVEDTVSHTFDEPGEYQVRLTVTDDDGNTSTSFVTLYVGPESPKDDLQMPPVARIAEFDKPLVVGEEVTFDGRESFDLDTAGKQVSKYEWNLQLRGKELANETGPMFTADFPQPGTYSLTLKVTDKDGLTGQTTEVVTATYKPEAKIDSPTSPVPVNEEVQFDGSGSEDIDGSIISYRWEFRRAGSQSPIIERSGATISQSLSKVGEYSVTLIVTDDDGATARTTRSLAVAETGKTIVVKQDGIPIEITPLSTGETVEEFYEYSETNWGANTTTGIEREQVSELFLFDGPRGRSLVIIHGPGGGLVSFDIEGLPEEGQWVVRDDPGEFDSKRDSSLDWAYAPSATDGGAFRGGLDGTFEITITPAFNDAAEKTAKDAPEGTIPGELTDWQFLSGHSASPKRVSLNMTEPVTIIRTNKEANEPPDPLFSLRPSKPVRGEEVTFDASASTDPDGTPTEYEWIVSNGEKVVTKSGKQVIHRFTKAGKHEITLRVTDNEGVTTTHTRTVAVNHPPEPQSNVTPESPSVGEQVTFDASVTFDPDGTIVNYQWEVYRMAEGKIDTEPIAILGGQSVKYSFSDPATYTIKLTATDNDGASVTDSKTLTVGNQTPEVAFDANPPEPTLNEAVTFDAGQSTDPDGTITGYEWEVVKADDPDASPVETATGQLFTHTFTEPGTYSVRLTATDDDGATGTSALKISPTDGEGPVAKIEAPGDPVPVGKEVTVSGEPSMDPDDQITQYNWTLERDGDSLTFTGKTFTYQLSESGTYTVRLTVVNSDNVSASATTEITVGEVPVARFEMRPDSSPVAHEDVTFDATASTDPDGSVSSYEWQFRKKPSQNPERASGATVTRSFPGGTYAVTLTVRDQEGFSASTSKTLRVNQSPTAQFDISLESPTAGQEITFDAGTSRDPDGSIETYDWEFREKDTQTSATASGQTVTRSFASGEYTVILTVTDDDGAMNTTSKPLSIAPPPKAPTAQFNISPASPTADQTVTFDASESSDPDGTVSRYEWEFRKKGSQNPETVSGVTVDWDFATGEYAITLTVTDDAGQTDRTTKTLHVAPPPEPPAARFDISDDSPTPDETVAFDASRSTNPDGSIASYEWAIYPMEGGQIDTEPVANMTGQTATYSFGDSIRYAVELTVTDDSGATDTTSKRVIVNTPPKAAFEMRPSSPDSSDEVIFDASGSTDPDGSIETYEWAFREKGVQNPETTSGETVTWSFLPGEYTVTLTVTDDAGVTATISKSLTVEETNRSPTATIEAPTRAYVGETITLDGSGSSDPDGEIVSHEWTIDPPLGDTVRESGSSVSYSVSNEGTHRVDLTVTDDDGATATRGTSFMAREPPTEP